MLKSKEWRSELNSSEKILYIELKRKFAGHNNGEIRLHYSELEDMMANSTICKAFKGLEKKGWINRTAVGGYHRFIYYFKLTGNYDEAIRIQGM